MIEGIIIIIIIVAMVGNISYILLSCENSSVSQCGNGTQLKQDWEEMRTQYTPPFFKWVDWLRSMWRA